MRYRSYLVGNEDTEYECDEVIDFFYLPELEVFAPTHYYVWSSNLMHLLHLVIGKPERLSVVDGVAKLVFVAGDDDFGIIAFKHFGHMVNPTFDDKNVEIRDGLVEVVNHWEIIFIVLVSGMGNGIAFRKVEHIVVVLKLVLVAREDFDFQRAGGKGHGNVMDLVFPDVVDAGVIRRVFVDGVDRLALGEEHFYDRLVVMVRVVVGDEKSLAFVHESLHGLWRDEGALTGVEVDSDAGGLGTDDEAVIVNLVDADAFFHRGVQIGAYLGDAGLGELLEDGGVVIESVVNHRVEVVKSLFAFEAGLRGWLVKIHRLVDLLEKDGALGELVIVSRAPVFELFSAFLREQGG